ncbi:MFS transporter [Actinocorallia longicatena]|uniref:MFS transporter n=1 Tax=Actinocorallia longicatena TaxID=111803 RepID=A0ABP6QI96_9ACTN
MSTTPTTAPPEGSGDPTGRLDGASKARIFTVLTVIVLFTEVAPLQYTMVSAALQKIGPAFPSAGANLTWAIIIFGLIGAAVSPLIGKMADIWGKKRMFLVCGGFFLVGCLVCATTSSWGVFLAGRAFQAIAIATAVIAYGLIRDLLPRHLVPLGIGITSTGLGFSALIAPVLGGWLVDNHSWRAIFWFLFIYTLVVFPLVWFLVPESGLRTRERLDIVGAALLAIGVGLILVYVDKGQDWGWSRPSAWLWAVAGVVLVAAFVAVERRATQPIMDMKLLFDPRVSTVLVVGLFAGFMVGVHSYTMGYLTLTPPEDATRSLVVQGTVDTVTKLTGQPVPPQAVNVTFDPGYSYGEGWSLMEYATHLAIWLGLVAMIAGALAGAWSRRVGARLPLLLALVTFVATAVLYALTPHEWVWLTLLSIPFGIAFGAYYATAPNLIIEAVPAEQQGVSAGMLGVMQSMGVAIGLAISTAFLNANPVKAVVAVGPQPPATSEINGIFADNAYELSFWLVAGTSVVALVAAYLMRHGRTPATGGSAH